jgi:predicted nucleotidyltransferase component of viral defense system
MHRACLPGNGWKVLGSLKDMLMRNQAIMAGGTALALHIGHRISVDLDFFTTEPFRVESLVSAIMKTGQSFHLMAESEDHLVADIEGVKFSLFRYEYPFIERPSAYRGIQVAGVLDIAAMKIIAISQRGAKRDFVDLYFILQDIPFHKVAEHMVLRFGKKRLNPIVTGKALVYFSDADADPEPEYIGKKVTWETIKTFFRQHVKQFVLDLRASERHI